MYRQYIITGKKNSPFFSIFSEKSGTKIFTAAVYSRFYKSVEKDFGMETGKIEILEDYFSK